MSEMLPASTSAVGRSARRATRSIRDNQLRAAVRGSACDAEADVTNIKIENITMATGTAMRAVVQVCQAHEAMEHLVPGAATRLAMLADDHALGMAATLADLRRDLRRR